MGEILIVVDGMTDERFLAEQQASVCEILGQPGGYINTTPNGLETETLFCMQKLLKVSDDKIKNNTRGYFEALGAGINVGKNDLIFRTTCMSCRDDIIIKMEENSIENVKNDDWEFHKMGGYKGLLVLKNCKDQLENVKTCLPHMSIGKEVLQCLPTGNEFLLEIVGKLSNNNTINLPWGQSVYCQIDGKEQGRAAISATNVVLGICKELGYNCYTPAGCTGYSDTNLQGKLQTAQKLIKDYNFVLLHINGADEEAHFLNYTKKREFAMQAILQVAKPLFALKHRVWLCADHGTSPFSGKHLNFLQPYWANFDA